MNTQRALCTIAREIQTIWPKPYFGAVPYLNALTRLNTVSDKFGEDDAKTMIIYFLSNATSWRGDDARRIKAELKKMAGLK